MFSRASSVLAALLAVISIENCLAANHILYDGGVRTGVDTTITAGTYTPQIGASFAAGTGGIVLGNQGNGWNADTVGPLSASASPPTRNVSLYNPSTGTANLWGKQFAVGAHGTILTNTGMNNPASARREEGLSTFGCWRSFR